MRKAVGVERVSHVARARYRTERLARLEREHQHLLAKLRREGLGQLQIEDALEAAERERVLDLVGLDHACGERPDDE